jgi:catalase (peroxidase I)
MTVLIGGIRVLGANVAQSRHGVFTQRPGVLSNASIVEDPLSVTTKKWLRF